MVKDLSGMKFGRLTVKQRADDNISDSGYHTVMWNCTCDCGNEVVIRGKCLTGGVTNSCGCLAKELLSERASKHHGYGTRLYAVWNSMRQRCNNKNHRAYPNYGGRGINICNEWDDYAVFREWAIASGYDETAARGTFTLDRINTDGNYCPENCRWANMKEQTNNRRCTPYYEIDGERHTLLEWSKITGIKYETLWRRYDMGWDAERALKS